jgi:hypothetical protein
MMNNDFIRSHPISIRSRRMRALHKRAFRAELLEFVTRANPNTRITFQRGLGGTNVLVGNIKTAKTIIGAHYDTPPAMPVWFMKHLRFWSFIGLPLIMFLFGYLSLHVPIGLGVTGDTLIQWYYVARAIYLLMTVSLILHVFGFTPFDNKINDNDNTSGVITLMKMIASKRIFSEDVCYVFFDNEEKFLLGSIMFRLRYNKWLKNKKIIILDCVAVGDGFHVISGKNKTITSDIVNDANDLNIPTINRKSTIMTMSDQVAFWGLDACLLLGWSVAGNNSLQHIHTRRDCYPYQFENTERAFQLLKHHMNKERINEVWKK